MRRARTLLDEVKRSVQNLAYNNPLYQKMLASGEVPDRLYFTVPDLWPGHADRGAQLLQSMPLLWGEGDATQNNMIDNLRDLRALGTEAARSKAFALVQEGMRDCQGWSDQHWLPEAIGERIYAWVSFFDFYAARADVNFHAALAESLYRQWKHLWRTLPASMSGLPALHAVMGLMIGSLNFPEGDKALGLSCDFLRRLLATDLAADGMHLSRNPETQLAFLQQLVTCRALFRAAELPLPDDVRMAIGTMTPALKFFRYGDGALGVFQGGHESESLLIDAVLTQTEIRTRTSRRLTQSAFERVQAGRSLMLIDGGLPHAADGLAGLGAFEFSHGRDRIIVNCGVPLHANAEWKRAMSSTAAHSTLCLNDTNAIDLEKLSNVRHRAVPRLHRYEELDDAGQKIAVIEFSHEGYVPLGVHCLRTLKLNEDGDVLQGEERIEGKAGINYALHWHLHPDLTVALSQDEMGVLLRTASGSGWRLRSYGGTVSLESGLYCGAGHKKPTHHIRLSGVTQEGVTILEWCLMRERK